MQIWPEALVKRQGLQNWRATQKLVRNPGPRCFEGRQKYFKKNARGELLFRRNLPH